MVTKERFAQGMTLDQYVEQMGANRERFKAALDRAASTPPDGRILERLGRPRKVMVITEDWCGTSMVYVPVVAALAAGDPGLELRVFLRDANPDLMDQYLKRGLYRSIPVFAFFDAEMNELARFSEEAPA